MDERGVCLGEAFEEDYLVAEAELAQRILTLLRIERFALRKRSMLSDSELSAGAENLFLHHELAKLELQVESLRSARENQHPITEKQKSAYLNIIGALLGLLRGVSPAGKPYSSFQSQQAVIDGIQANFGEAPGLSQRNLEEKFALAKRQLLSSKH